MKRIEKLEHLSVVAINGKTYITKEVYELPNGEIVVTCLEEGIIKNYSEQEVLIKHNNLLYSTCEYLALK